MHNILVARKKMEEIEEIEIEDQIVIGERLVSESSESEENPENIENNNEDAVFLGGSGLLTKI